MTPAALRGCSAVIMRVLVAAGMVAALWAFPRQGLAQVPSAGEGTPEGICSTWNGEKFVTRPCVGGPGSGRSRERGPKEPSAEEEARNIDRYGRLLYEESRLEEALAQFERARGIDRFDGAAYYGICLVNAAWGNYPNAVSHCELALSYGTRPVWGVSRQELVRYIDQLRAKSAEQREAHQDEQAFRDCLKYYEAMDWERALHFLDSYTKSRPGARRLQEAHAMRGTVLTRLGRFGEAEQALYKAYTLYPKKALRDVEERNHPNLADALWDLEVSRAHAIRGKDLDSRLLKISLLQQSLRFSPDNYRSLFWLADAEMEAFRYPEARMHLMQAMESYMTAGSLRQSFGTRAQQFHGYPEPTDFGRAVEIRQGIIQDALRAAQASLAKADSEAAKGASDGNGSFLEWPGYLRSSAYMVMGKPGEAQAILRELLRKSPDNAIFRENAQTLARILVHQPLYINEASRQAEAARRKGREAVLYEVDQNMKCVAGEPFDGIGSCINNGFRWP